MESPRWTCTNVGLYTVAPSVCLSNVRRLVAFRSSQVWESHVTLRHDLPRCCSNDVVIRHLHTTSFLLRQSLSLDTEVYDGPHPIVKSRPFHCREFLKNWDRCFGYGPVIKFFYLTRVTRSCETRITYELWNLDWKIRKFGTWHAKTNQKFKTDSIESKLSMLVGNAGRTAPPPTPPRSVQKHSAHLTPTGHTVDVFFNAHSGMSTLKRATVPGLPIWCEEPEAISQKTDYNAKTKAESIPPPTKAPTFHVDDDSAALGRRQQRRPAQQLHLLGSGDATDGRSELLVQNGIPNRALARGRSTVGLTRRQRIEHQIYHTAVRASVRSSQGGRGPAVGRLHARGPV